MVTEILQAVVARFNLETGRTAAGKSVPLYIGERYINQNDAPPRIAATPGEDTFSAPTRIGMVRRAVKTASNGWEVAIWGPDAAASPPDDLADFEAVRQMRDDFVVALHREMRARFGDFGGQPQAYSIIRSRWSTPGQLTALGFVVIFDLVLKTPVLVSDELAGTAFIETEAISGHIE